MIGTFSIRTNRFKNEKFLARTIDGKPVIWFGSGCPNNPEVRQMSLNLVEEIASMEGVDAIILDGIRFASPGEGIKTFMTCFCEECWRKSRELGYDMTQMKVSLKNIVKHLTYLNGGYLNSIKVWKSPIDFLDFLLRFPGVLEWLRFRADSITEHVEDVIKVVKSINSHCKVGAYLFSPSLSYLVGQDYRSLGRLLDYVEPMIYRIGNGVACINYELAKMALDIYERSLGIDQKDLQIFLFRLFGLNSEPKKNIKDLAKGLSPKIIEGEVSRAIGFVEASKIIPVLFLNDPHYVHAVEYAIKGGAQRISFFRFSHGSERMLSEIARLICG